MNNNNDNLDAQQEITDIIHEIIATQLSPQQQIQVIDEAQQLKRDNPGLNVQLALYMAIQEIAPHNMLTISMDLEAISIILQPLCTWPKMLTDYIKQQNAAYDDYYQPMDTQDYQAMDTQDNQYTLQYPSAPEYNETHTIHWNSRDIDAMMRNQ